MTTLIEAARQALEALEKLWDIIDDIDTYGDMAKSDDKLYRSLVERRQRQRFEQTGISTDGYELNGGAITSLRQAIEQAEKQEPIKIDGNTSDGYHTFNELYEFRKAYNVALFNEWASGGKCSVHKSWRHHDGELCFGGGWFIVVAVLPQGQISNHYEAKDWNLFAIPEVERALFEFDGHTGNDVIERLEAYTTPQPQREWIGLTQEDIDIAFDDTQEGGGFNEFARAIEQTLQRKNT